MRDDLEYFKCYGKTYPKSRQEHSMDWSPGLNGNELMSSIHCSLLDERRHTMSMCLKLLLIWTQHQDGATIKYCFLKLLLIGILSQK